MHRIKQINVPSDGRGNGKIRNIGYVVEGYIFSQTKNSYFFLQLLPIKKDNVPEFLKAKRMCGKVS